MWWAGAGLSGARSKGRRLDGARVREGEGIEGKHQVVRVVVVLAAARQSEKDEEVNRERE